MPDVNLSFDWHLPVAVRFGAGCSDGLAAALGDRPAVVLAFEPARALGLFARWKAQWGSRLRAWVDVPDGLASLALGRELATEVWPALEQHPCTVLIGVGGGSTLDLAKLLRCRPADGSFQALAAAIRGQAPWPALLPAPLWLLPTTAGTGSEVTRWATLWDTDTAPAVKRSFDETFGWAERAFVDPLLTLSVPRAVTRDSALDTLSHALEAIWNRNANPVSDRLAVAAAQRVVSVLPRCLNEPGNVDLRSDLALAALQAGIAFSQTRTALAHALSYALTLDQGVPHGLACALWLPTAWRLAQGRDARVDGLLREVFSGAESLQDWLQTVGAGLRPQELGIADAEARIAAALVSARGRNFIGAA